ncbi:MAG: endopeptidase La [Bacilli bacterium]|nr:endopeptidase La [Bacilli bacterium]
MMKTNLPVILLRGIVLLPNNDIKLEFEKGDSSIIIDEAEMFHHNKLLVVCDTETVEDVNYKKLPKMGIISKLSHKIELPNGRIRIVISGLSRAKVDNYLNADKKDEVLEAIVTELDEEVINEKEEKILVEKVKKEMNSHVKTISYLSNSILEAIKNVDSLSKITDIVAMSLAVELERLVDYLNCLNPEKRTNMILADLYEEEEKYNIERNLDLKVKKEIDENQREYFLREKLRLIKEELGDISPKDEEVDELKEKIDNLQASDKIKTRLSKELSRYEALSTVSPEINLIRNYIDWLLELPWCKSTIDNEDLQNVKEILDLSHYGLDKVKERIIEFLAVKKNTDSLNGPILCLVGPPGVGKTSLAFSIAKAMNRNFVKMSVGGVNDEAEIMGHRRTYLGANPGRIITSMKKAKSNNPVFLIDEIDKMTKDIKGDPASSLLEVLDPEQNSFFSDNYIEEEFDLSKVMFIATANYMEQIPEALKDRLEIVKLSGYTEFEKLDIAKKHLLPKVCEEHGFNYDKLDIADALILNVIRNYTKEAGVRELERQLANIVRKIVTSMVINNIRMEKVKVDDEMIKKYLGNPKYQDYEKNAEQVVGVVNGLAYTSFGGDTLPIEVNFYEGKGNLVLTGSLGDVMKESAQIALSYIKSHIKEFGIDYDKITKNDIHIHVPEGATPKDGPSAGITLTTALISALANLRVDNKLAMTGEITLRGKVLPIGGLKEKSIGANRNGIKKIIIPYDNIADLDEVPKEIKDTIEYIPVKEYMEVFEIIKKG